jgi:membrane fusion protein, multidrug efflux system
MSTMRLLHGAAAVMALLVMVSCGTEAKSVPSTTLGARQETAAIRPPVAVDVVRVTPSDVTETVDVVGSLAPKFVADVKSEVTGVVTAVYVTEWVPVRKGTPLARLDTGETDAAIEALKAVAAQARVVETRARREHDRALELQHYGLITPQALDEARFALDAATAGTVAALAQIRTAEARLAKSLIRAPMDGVVALRHVSVGDRVENMGGGEPMFRIVDNRVLDLIVTVPASRAANVRVGQPLAFTTDAVPGGGFAGRVMFINPAVDEINRSVRVVATVSNSDNRLKGGAFVRGRIVTATRAQVLQVPRGTLIDWNMAARTAAVFVVVGERVERRAVATGAVSEQSVEIASGLVAGEPVVIRGGFALRPGDTVIVAGEDEGE